MGVRARPSARGTRKIFESSSAAPPHPAICVCTRRQFAILPRRLADDYFLARDAINMCAPLGALWRASPLLPPELVGKPSKQEEHVPFATHFFRQVDANASTWADLAANVYNEALLSYWLKEVSRVPYTAADEMSETHMYAVRGDGSRLDIAWVNA